MLPLTGTKVMGVLSGTSNISNIIILGDIGDIGDCITLPNSVEALGVGLVLFGGVT